jgi:hypothetical protein
LFDPSPLRGETRGFRRLCKNTTGARTFLSASTALASSKRTGMSALR